MYNIDFELEEEAELIEMFVNEDTEEWEEEQGIEAVSVVENPATESMWIALKEENIENIEDVENSLHRLNAREVARELNWNWRKIMRLFLDTLTEANLTIERGIIEQSLEVSGIRLKKQTNLSTSHNLKLAEISQEKQILMGALLVPQKAIPRFDEKNEKKFSIFFSEQTLFKIMTLYMKKGKQNNTTEEHEIKLDGNTIIEMWQKEDMVHDKSAIHGLKDPVGSIMITMHIPDKEKFDKIKNSKNGFSLEGRFTDKLNLKKLETPVATAIIDNITTLLREN